MAPWDAASITLASNRSIRSVLTLDLSRTVGWAFGWTTDRNPQFGFFNLPNGMGEGARLCAFENTLAEKFEELQPEAVVLEAPLPLPALNNWNSACQQFGLRALAFSEAYRQSCAISEVSADLVRQDVLGQRRFSRDVVKREVVRYCLQRGWKVPNHHVADACLIWEWYRMRMNGISPCVGPLWRAA